MYSPVNSETTLQRLSFEASLLLPNWFMLEENNNLFIWSASQLPWNYLLLVQSKRKPNETQKDPPSIILSSFGLVTVSLKPSPSLHLEILLHFDHIFFFYWNMKHIPYNWSFLCKYAVLVFIVFYYTFKIVQLSPVSISRIFSSFQ